MTERFNDGVIDLSQFKKNKEAAAGYTAPFFSEACKIEFENEHGAAVFYTLMMNFVYKERQVVVVEELTDDEPNGTIVIAEAIINDGQFYGLQRIESDEEFTEITDIITHHLALDDDDDEEDDDDESWN